MIDVRMKLGSAGNLTLSFVGRSATIARMLKLLLPLVVVTAAALGCILEAAPLALTEFTNGQKTKFSTKDHAKAKGLNMTISYPDSWGRKEGERPNILQKFVSNGGSGTELFMIVTKSLPATPSDAELNSLFTEQSLKEFIPEGSTFVSGKPTKLEGLPAGILEYSQRRERAGMTVDMHTVTYIFFSGPTMVQIQCQVGSLPGAGLSAKEKMEEYKPLFTLIASSVVLPDKWK